MAHANTVVSAALVALSLIFGHGPAQAEEPEHQNSIINKVLKTQRATVSAALRTDFERLRAVSSLMSTILDEEDLDLAELSLPQVSLVLTDVKLPPNVTEPVFETLTCVEAAVANKRPLTSCKRAHAVNSVAIEKFNARATARRIVAMSNDGGIVANPLRWPKGAPLTWIDKHRSTQKERSVLALSFFGQSVDVELSRLFLTLAQQAPELLRPIPLDPQYRNARCLNGPYVNYVGPDIAGAADRYKSIIAQSGEPSPTDDGDVLRFGLFQSDLAQKVAFVGGGYPLDLSDYSVDTAFALVRDEFSARYGLKSAFKGDQVISALLTLWVTFGQKDFETKVSAFLGRDVAGQQVGPALAETGLRGQALWDAMYSHAVRHEECRVADKILEAYGLVYREGHTPIARRVLNQLEDKVGYRAVPSLTMTPVSRKYFFPFERELPTCRKFGPVEQAFEGAEANDCHLDVLDFGDGIKKNVVLAGGAKVEFHVTDEEKERLIKIVRDMEKADRGGDILRWAADIGAPIDTQSIGAVVAMDAIDNRDIPCVNDQSFYIDPSDRDTMIEHFNDYRSNFYPATNGSLKRENLQIFLIDEFKGFSSDAFTAIVLPHAERLAGAFATYQDASPDEESAGINHAAIAPFSLGVGEDAADKVPSLAQVSPDLENLCLIVQRQLEAIKQSQDLAVKDVSHGAFLESLLFDTSSGFGDVDRLGLLSDEENLVASEFLSSNYETVAARNDLKEVMDNAGILGDRLTSEAARSTGDEPIGVINISMGRDYSDTSAETLRTAGPGAFDEHKANFGASNHVLFVLAAGQPSFDTDSIEDVRDLEEIDGTFLERINPLLLEFGSNRCAFLPACFSRFTNVVTVGAVKPSVFGFTDGLPVLMPWSNRGPAVTLAAPGHAVISNDLAFLPNDGGLSQLKALQFSSLRDGTSVATAFVSALAVKIAAENPELTPAEIKLRLISTAQPYINTNNTPELLKGEEGELFAGVIDPLIALRNPSKYYVTYRTTASGGAQTVEYDLIRRTAPKLESDRRLFSFFQSARSSERAVWQCSWKRLLRLHFKDEVARDDDYRRFIPHGSVACLKGGDPNKLQVGQGSFGTKNIQHNTCLVNDTCFEALSGETGGWVPLKIADIRDIYFPIIAP